VRLVLVLGAQPQIDRALYERGLEPIYVGGYRVTNEDSLECAIESAGKSRTAIERYMSKVRTHLPVDV
jgi:amino-acid N-acetyltransferase